MASTANARIRSEVSRQLRDVRADIRELKANDEKQSKAIDDLQRETRQQTETLGGLSTGVNTILQWHQYRQWIEEHRWKRIGRIGIVVGVIASCIAIIGSVIALWSHFHV